MLRCLHLADLHLGWSPSELPAEKATIRQRERDLLLKRAVDFALAPENRIDLVIIAGDLFESHRPEPAVADEAVRQLERLARAALPLVTVPGNHDEITYHDSIYRQRSTSWPGLLVRNPMPQRVALWNVNGTPVSVYSLAYTGGLTRVEDLTNLPRAEGPGIHIGAFHGSLDWQAGDRSLPIASEALAAAGYHYVALGHIHRYAESKTGTGVAVYPGMVEAKGFDDPGTGKLTVVQLTDTAGAGSPRVTVETFPLPVRRHASVEIDVSAVPSRDALAEACRAAAGDDRDACVKITLRGTPSFPVDTTSLARSLQEDFFYVEIADETTFTNEDLVSRLAAQPTIQGYFVRRLAARLESTSDARERKVLELAIRKGLAAFREGGGAR